MNGVGFFCIENKFGEKLKRSSKMLLLAGAESLETMTLSRTKLNDNLQISRSTTKRHSPDCH